MRKFLMLILLVRSVSALALEKKTLTIEAILSFPYPRELALSPDGKYIAFLSTRPYEDSEGKGTSQIWGIPTDGGEAWLLTRAPKGVESFKWSPDGKIIAYITPETLPEEKKEV